MIARSSARVVLPTDTLRPCLKARSRPDSPRRLSSTAYKRSLFRWLEPISIGMIRGSLKHSRCQEESCRNKAEVVGVEERASGQRRLELSANFRPA